MEITKLRHDFEAKDELIEDLIHDACDSISLSNDLEVKEYNNFLDEVMETCRQMRVQKGEGMWILRVFVDTIEKVRFEFNEYVDLAEFQNTLTETIVNNKWSISIEREEY